MGTRIIKKIIFLLLLLLVFLNIQTMSVYADEGGSGGKTTSDSYGDAAIDDWWKASKNEIGSDPVDKSKNIMGSALNLAQIIAIGVVIVMGMALGIKFMVSSVEDRAEIKKHLIAYTVGTLIILSAVLIVRVIMNFADSIEI